MKIIQLLIHIYSIKPLDVEHEITMRKASRQLLIIALALLVLGLALWYYALFL